MFFIVSRIKELFFLCSLFSCLIGLGSENDSSQISERIDQVVISRCCICHECNYTASSGQQHMMSQCKVCKQVVHFMCLYNVVTKSSHWPHCPYCRVKLSRDYQESIVTLKQGLTDDEQYTPDFLKKVLFLRRVQVELLQQKLRDCSQVSSEGNRDISHQEVISDLLIEKQKECGKRITAMSKVQQLKVKNDEYFNRIVDLQDSNRQLEADKARLEVSVAALEREKS